MAADGTPLGEVEFAGRASASTLLHEILTSAREQHRDALGTVDLGASPGEFKKRYGNLLPGFEAARADSEERTNIAATLVDAARSAITWRTEADEVPLIDHVSQFAEPLPLEVSPGRGDGNLDPHVPYEGAVLVGGRLIALARDLVERGSASEGVSGAIARVVELAGTTGIDLRDRRIVVLGAGAELAPTRLWLEGGADVLWIDVTPPPADLLASDARSGTIRWASDGADLLRQPERIRATVEEYAADGAVDVGLYAYAPGRGREWRLAGAMDAIVDALPNAAVRTVTMLVSPTTCGVLTPAELAGESRRRRDRPRWQSALDRVGLLGRGSGHVRSGKTCANRGIVPIQGTSYQAAQYLGKQMAAVAWATADPPLHVSANMAGISHTASLRHPVFDTAFGGAEAFGVETFEPATTASLNGLLALRDWLDPADEGQTDGTGAMTWCRVHGGIYEVPYELEPTLRVATAIGVARDPRRINALLGRG